MKKNDLICDDVITVDYVVNCESFQSLGVFRLIDCLIVYHSQNTKIGLFKKKNPIIKYINYFTLVIKITFECKFCIHSPRIQK